MFFVHFLDNVCCEARQMCSTVMVWVFYTGFSAKVLIWYILELQDVLDYIILLI